MLPILLGIGYAISNLLGFMAILKTFFNKNVRFTIYNEIKEKAET